MVFRDNLVSRTSQINEANPALRNISDTARWVAYFRARETQREDALFRDAYAERLAGERGFQIAAALPDASKHQWAWAARTLLFDQYISRAITQGAGIVVNLAAGLDARPYRMQLPPALQWVEVDLPEILSYKEEILGNEEPRCRLERIRLDLSDGPKRRSLFSELNRPGAKTVVACEGLLIYLSPEEVGSLAQELAAQDHFQNWIVDLASPGQLKLMQISTGKKLREARAAYKFAPPEGADFFAPFGWQVKDVQGFLKTAAQYHRAPAELLTLLPEPQGPLGNYPWSGACLLEKPQRPLRPKL